METRRASPSCRSAVGRIADWADARGLRFLHDGQTGHGAVFSPCGDYRYLLWREGGSRGRFLGMGLLNPSTADHRADDPTIRRCRQRAMQVGQGGLLVWNLFAFRATRPQAMRATADPVGCENDAAIELALDLSERTIIGWGNHGAHRGRSREVLDRCIGSLVLGFTKSGEPRHPLYVTAATLPLRWEEIANDQL